MIKVKETRMYKVIQQYAGCGEGLKNMKPIEVLVAEAKLVLIPLSVINDKEWIKSNGEHVVFFEKSKDNYNMFKPILISEIEKIEGGDCLYPKQDKLPWNFLCEFVRTSTIEEVKAAGLQADSDAIMVSKWKQEDGYCSRLSPDLFYKVLALPEHFSPKHLQAIVDGKMKDGDKVLVETESLIIGQDNHELIWSRDQYIKFNSSNHITLRKDEEKMYTREEVYQIYLAALSNYRMTLDMKKSWDTDQWFEQNVK